jgi:hypothetical protein
LFHSTEARLAAHPAGGKVGPDEWATLFIEPAYFEQPWLQWAQVFANWVHRHDSGAATALISLYQAVDTPATTTGSPPAPRWDASASWTSVT